MEIKMGNSSTKAKNKYNAINYDRVGLMLPKGKAEEWKALAKAEGLSLNAFIIKCVQNYTNNEKTV